jgi:hypothetical protein
MMEAIQQVMGNVTDIGSLHPVSLPTDKAALRVRRNLARLIEEEKSAAAEKESISRRQG